MEFRNKREALDFYEKEYPHISKYFIEMAIDLDMQNQADELELTRAALVNLSLTNSERFSRAKQRRDNRKNNKL